MTFGPVAGRPQRPRRSCLAVPGSSAKMIRKAQALPADHVFLDLEDAVAPSMKADARRQVVEALVHGDWAGKTRSVRINDADTEWAHQDVLQLMSGAGRHLDTIVLPKVERIAHVHWLDMLLAQIERAEGLPGGGTGVELQIEGPGGLSDIEPIAGASARTEALIFGPWDFMAAMRMPVTQRNPAAGGDDRFDTTMMAIAVAARKHGLQAIDGPYPELRDLAGCRRSAERAAGFGYDGKWVLHPDQIEVVNTAFSPTQDEYDQAEITLAAYDYHVSAEGGHNGAAVLGGLMIDEASRRVAALTAERGRLLSMQRTKYFNP